jgi:hypothetical protein
MLTAKITSEVIAQQKSQLDLTAPEADISRSYVQQYSDGTGANQAQKMFSDARTVAGSSSDNLDLAGSLPDALGATLTFAAIKEIIVKNKSAANQLRIGKKISNGFAGPFDQTAGALGVVVEPNGILRLNNPSANGWPVTAATADLLSVENLGATSSDYEVILIGK